MKNSFVIPYRNKNRGNQLSFMIKHLRYLYGNLTEIIVSEQIGKQPILRGQLLNLGFKRSTGDVIIFIDVDMRFIEKFPIEKEVNNNNTPFCTWNILEEASEDKNGNIRSLNKIRVTGTGFGGSTVFTRDQFIKTGGFSNLFFGWGREDTVMKIRANVIKLPYKMYHISHASDGTNPYYSHNAKMYNTILERDNLKDSYKQTISDGFIEKNENNLIIEKHNNIRVIDNFEYKNLIPKELQI